jgi:hypothetical protein
MPAVAGSVTAADVPVTGSAPPGRGRDAGMVHTLRARYARFCMLTGNDVVVLISNDGQQCRESPFFRP